LQATFSTTTPVFAAAASFAAPFQGAAWACQAANRIAVAAVKLITMQLRILGSPRLSVTPEKRLHCLARAERQKAISVIAITADC